jgi:biopolymer transport protein ExbB
MEQSFGLLALWQQSDWVNKLVALLLLGMSIASWVVIVIKAMDLTRLGKIGQRVGQFWEGTDYQAGLNALHGSKGFNPFQHLAQESQAALAHLRHHDGQPHLREALDADEWVGRALHNAIDDGQARLQSGLAILASVGSTAPFVGLFGTVWGIYHALMKIGLSGQSTIDQVAGPIGESLIMTALGLAVAIPAVLGYNALVRGNKSVMLKVKRFARDLHALHITGGRVRSLPKARTA